MNLRFNQTYALCILLLLIFIGGTVFFYYSSPEKLIVYIGAENVYALMFVLALLGGLTTFSSIPYHVVLVMLASGGLNPLFLGVAAAAGVMAGDATSYFVGYSGRNVVPLAMQKNLQKFCSFCLAHPKILPVVFFLYGSFSNDFIVISMGLARYPFWRVMVPLGSGNFVFNISLAYLAFYAYDFLQGVFIFLK